MKLFILRHGLAVERSVSSGGAFEDASRELLPKGRERTLKMALLLKKYCLETEDHVERIISSPYIRALQTAEILSEQLKLKEIHKCSELIPSAPPQAFAQWMKIYGGHKKNVLIVGHEPNLSLLTTWLMAGQADPIVEIKKSALLCLETENLENLNARSCTLKWLVPFKLS